LWANILRVADGAGSANREGTDETVFSLYVCTAQHDEYPDSKLYRIGPFDHPKVIKKVDSESGKSFTLFVKDDYGAEK